MPTVLIVEDEVQVLILAESALQGGGFETLTAGTIAEAQAIINFDKKLDLVFTNIALGSHENGGITVGQLVKSRNGTPLLYTSGRPQTDGMESLFADTTSKFLVMMNDRQEPLGQMCVNSY